MSSAAHIEDFQVTTFNMKVLVLLPDAKHFPEESPGLFMALLDARVREHPQGREVAAVL